MFPKGPRFEPVKISDVPGPNAYNVIPESQLEDYKRGAFFEKADRFFKEKPAQVPGPGAYDAGPKKKATHPAVNPPRQQTSLVDRYVILQRKVEDLEKVHNDGKKTYQSEVDRLKLELNRSQKTNAEQTDRLDKQKKQIDLLDGRIQDLKKAATTDEAEIKDLRVKLRTSEHERTHLATKQGEAGELKKSLQSIEAKRREELRDRDRRIAELEKSVATEKKKREFAEARLQEIKGKGDEEVHQARTAAHKLEVMVNESQAKVLHAQAALASFKKEAGNKEEELLSQLEQHRDLMARVAEEYGRLASSCIPTAVHKLLEDRHAASQMRILRLQRKLANSEGQVVELAHLIRQTKEQNLILAQGLREAEDEISLYVAAQQDATLGKLDPFLIESLDTAGADIVTSQNQIRAVDEKTLELISNFYRLTYVELLSEYSAAEKQLQEEQLISQQYADSLASTLVSHEAIAARLENVKEERNTLDMRLRTTIELAETLRSSSESMARKVSEMEEKLAEAAIRGEAALKKEKDTVQRLNGTVQKGRMAEDALRSEIEQLTADLIDAARYQEAYYLLSDEVGGLVARNQLAEEEAQRLSKFNAEILSHNNPAQRIMYVDRIRRELAETKHKLVMLTREQEVVVAANEDLQHELDMYKSVMVPLDQKPRTNIIRIGRPPLVHLTHGVNTSVLGKPVGVSGGERDEFAEKLAVDTEQSHMLDTIAGDMTVDEIS